MSSVLWDGDNLIQKLGREVEQLGHVRLDENAGVYVLWLKDTRGVFGPGGTYVRGDTFPSMKDAKRCAASSVSASLFHHMWLMGLREGSEHADPAIDQAIANAQEGRPLEETTFKEEMERLTHKLDEVQANARESVTDARKRQKWYFVAGLAVALIGILISVL